MVMGSGLLALAMVAADGPSCPPVETTTYQVRVLTLDGLDWRTACYSRLQPVAHQGTSTIWTADRALAASLADRAKGESPCHTIMAVGEATLTKADTVNYVAAVERFADGPMNQSSAIAFMPRPEQLEERFSIKVAGRKLDQGILTKIALDETHVEAIHGVPQTESLVPPPPKDAKNSAEHNKGVVNTILAAMPVIPQSKTITSSVQIPEVSRASVAGEWLIPKDGVLIISLGVKTAADDKGKAVVRERVAVVEACSFEPNGTAEAARTIPVSSAPFQHVKLGQPVVPGRSMPEAIDPNGNLVDLPPLPEALASADLDRIKPEPNQASPQSPLRSAPSPSADPALARTSFDAAPPAPKVPAGLEEVVGEDINVELTDFIKALIKAGVKSDATIELDGRSLILPDGRRATRVKSDATIELDGRSIPLKNMIFEKAEDACEASATAKAKAVCEKCDGDPTFCPAMARSMKVGEVPGGLRLVREGKSRLGVTVTDADGIQVFGAVGDLEDILKVPGKTGTTVVPLGPKFSLELKATVVPVATEKPTTAEKDEAGPSRR